MSELLHVVRVCLHYPMISLPILEKEGFVSYGPHLIENLIFGIVIETNFRLAEIQLSVGIVSAEK